MSYSKDVGKVSARYRPGGEVGAFALCTALSMLLPRTAVSEEALTES